MLASTPILSFSALGNDKELLDKGIESFANKRHDEAMTFFDKVIANNPKRAVCAAAYYNKGVVLESLGEYSKALEMYERAINLDPKLVPAYNNKANVLMGLGRDQEALEVFSKGIELDPKYALNYYNKGCCLGKLSKHIEAIEAFDEAIRINPKLAQA